MDTEKQVWTADFR